MNTPNKLSLLRMFLIPVMIFLYLASFVPYGKIFAIVVFVLASLTDMLDGYIARKTNTVTNLGKLLDPIADKLLVMSGLLLVVCDATIPQPYGVVVAILIIGRELLISAFRQIAASQNVIMAADSFGKLKTITQDVAIPLLFLIAFFNNTAIISNSALAVVRIVGYSLIGLATLFTILSGINYIVKNKNVLKG